MGKSIIVKDADFSRNSVGKIFDVSKLKQYDCSVGNKSVGWYKPGKHVLFEVSPRQVYYLKIKNANIGYVALLSSAHTEPVTESAKISYSPSTSDRISISSGEYQKLVIPDNDTKYLAINVVTGTNENADWDVYMMYE